MSENEPSIVRRESRPDSSTVPLVNPLQPSVVYRTGDADELDAVYEGRAPGFVYAREGHPNASVLAEKLAWMESGSAGVVTSSGMSAISAVMLSALRAGDHVVTGNQLYGRTARLMDTELPRFGVEVTAVDVSDRAAIETAIRADTRMLFAEVVSNPALRIADVPVLAEIAATTGAELVIDNTFPTPRGFRPFDHGADIVIHSVTKMLAGHSDATLGFVAVERPERMEAIEQAVVTYGLNASPFDCWLAERGLNTFDLRFERAQANARRLAELLDSAEVVDRVIYPGRPDHPDAGRAEALFGENGGTMVSFVLDGDRSAVNSFLRSTSGIPFAPTLGDVATTLSHPASSSHRLMSPADRDALGIPEGFLRVSVGVEDFELLEAEFTAALAAVS